MFEKWDFGKVGLWNFGEVNWDLRIFFRIRQKLSENLNKNLLNFFKKDFVNISQKIFQDKSQKNLKNYQKFFKNLSKEKIFFNIFEKNSSKIFKKRIKQIS